VLTPGEKWAAGMNDPHGIASIGALDFPLPLAEEYWNTTAAASTQWRSNLVSGADLYKTGIFAVVAGDFCLDGLRLRQFGSSETGAELQKPANSGLFCSLRVAPTASGLPGWRRSADRARLQPNSLLTGNFTGKFGALAVERQPLSRKTGVKRRPSSIFPIQIIREIESWNSEFSRNSRDLASSFRLDDFSTRNAWIHGLQL
jgi:hypothetical protein